MGLNNPIFNSIDSSIASEIQATIYVPSLFDSTGFAGDDIGGTGIGAFNMEILIIISHD
jgi:hypothetical protein